VQVLWGVFFSVTGFGKVLCYNPALWNQALHEVPWFGGGALTVRELDVRVGGWYSTPETIYCGKA